MPGKGIGHFVGAMRIDAFRPAEDFKSHIDNWIDAFKNAERIDEKQKVIIPGEPEFWMQAEREKNGIPLNDLVEKDLLELGEKLGVSLK